LYVVVALDNILILRPSKNFGCLREGSQNIKSAKEWSLTIKGGGPPSPLILLGEILFERADNDQWAPGINV
jgi:hypothetical protein